MRRRDRGSLALEARQRVGIVGEVLRQNLDRDLAPEPRIARPIHLAHSHIVELMPYFLSEFCARNNFRPRTIDPDAVEGLERYAWPGNIRELRNVVERMAILTPGDRITADAIALEVRSGQAPRAATGLQ